MDKRVFSPLLAVLVALSLAAAGVAAVLWSTTQEVSQTIQTPVEGEAVQLITLPTGYINVTGSYLAEDALNITTRVDDVVLQINQTEAQRTLLTDYYNTLILHVRPAGTTGDVMAFNLLASTSVSIVLSSPGTRLYDYYFEYEPRAGGVVTMEILVTCAEA